MLLHMVLHIAHISLRLSETENELELFLKKYFQT